VVQGANETTTGYEKKLKARKRWVTTEIIDKMNERIKYKHEYRRG